MASRSSYDVKIKEYNNMLRDTLRIYRDAVDFFIGVVINEWDTISKNKAKYLTHTVENFTIQTDSHPEPKYNFTEAYNKFPSYFRRAAINEAVGKVRGYMTKLEKGDKVGKPKAGNVFPVMYKNNMYKRISLYEAKIKVYIDGQWKWLEIKLNKSDVDYIQRHYDVAKAESPSLLKRGKEWFLNFAFTESIALEDKSIFEQKALVVDLGINHACVCSVLMADGSICAREFLSLAQEEDKLKHAISCIKKAQQHGASKTPRLWALANSINDDIAIKTAHFIIEMAVKYDVDVVVFEHLDLNGKKKGSKKQRLALWKAKYVQEMVTHKVHVLKDHPKRVSRVNAWNTSRLAFDGSGRVTRGTYVQDGKERYNYSICVFPSGKTYNCDLNASYNIGARYFIREILKSVPETVRFELEAKVPEASKRSTCTLSTLISLNAALYSISCETAEF